MSGLSSDYKVGSLTSMFEAKSPEADQNTLKSLFKSRAVQNPVKEAAKVPQVEPEVKVNPTKTKDQKDAEEEEYNTPSRRFQVRMEDNKEQKLDPEKEMRTVFVGNLPSKVTVKAVKRKFKEFGEVESVRLRGAARPDLLTTKRVAVIKRSLHENRHNINAYVRFKEKSCAEDSCKLNGSEFDSHILRVDLAMKEGGKVTHDQSKSIFLGNLPFSIEEDQVRNHFLVCGDIEDVRLVRDSSTGLGKGFGYINFKTIDSIVLALKMNGSQLEGRSLRVSRATNKPKQKIVTRLPKQKVKGLGTKGQPGRLPRQSKVIKKPKVGFQGKVGLKTREIKMKKKQKQKFKKSK